MTKCVFLDRDGVINVDKNYVHKIEDLDFIPNTFEALKSLQTKGFILFIVTNQSGIGRGYYTLEDYKKLRQYIDSKLKDNNINIIEEYFCPHHPDENCRCRKPGTKFIEEAITKYNINKDESYFIGDKTSDIKAGHDSGLKTILVLTGKAGLDKKYNIVADIICKDLYEASMIL